LPGALLALPMDQQMKLAVVVVVEVVTARDLLLAAGPGCW